jgi:predicted acetyltransferase
MELRLVVPSREYADGYADALRRGWSPNNLRAQEGAEELEKLAADADSFLASMVDREAKGAPITMPDGSQVPRLPGYRLWMWDGEFVGNIGLRWQRGSNELPPYVLGHIGYAVVPWKRGQGYGKEALRLMLAEARREGLAWVQITTDPDNFASRRVIEANGGVLIEQFDRGPRYGNTSAVRYRIDLPE